MNDARRTNAMPAAEPLASGSPRYRPTLMEVDLAAIGANLSWIKGKAGAGRLVIAALKADAYGHGAVGVARKLAAEGVDLLAVGSLDDAAALRAAGISGAILLLSAMVPEMAAEVFDLGLVPTVDEPAAAAALSALARDRAVPVFIKIDCGFGRFGVGLDAAIDFGSTVAAMTGLIVDGVYTHIPFSGPADAEWARRQLAAFGRAVSGLAAAGIRPRIVQALASPGLLHGLHDPHNAIAIGHLLYGVDPAAPALNADASALQPALAAVRTQLVHAGPRPAAEAAAAYLRNGFGRVGVIPVGIHHGYRPVAPEASVIVGGHRAAVLRPCLENTVVDLSEVPDAAVAGDVLLLGSSGGLTITLADLAGWHGTSSLTVLTALGRSLTRLYVGG